MNIGTYGPQPEKTCLSGLRRTKVQTSQRIRSLISAFVIRLLESVVSKLAYYKPNFTSLASLFSLGDWFESRFVRNPEDRFCHVAAHISLFDWGMCRP